MDVFLLGSCRFFVGTNSGVSYVPPIFGRPCLYTNWCALDHRPWWSANLLIHKNIRQRKSGDLVPYSRLIPPPLGHVESVDFLHGQGLELVDNSPEELADAIEEMIQLVEGRRKTGKKHQQDVEAYRQISAASGGYRGPGICETFLSRYPQLLN
jgi:putative glycosyltransferase (TIGR04372 family)